MASSTPKVILLSANGAERPLVERIADAAITPGMLCFINSDNEFAKHATAGGNTPRFIAVENPYSGYTTGAAIDHAYATGETVYCIYAQGGDVVYGFLANGENAAIGSPLKSDGAGGFAVWAAQAVDEAGAATFTIYEGGPIAYAVEALNNATGAQARLKVRLA